MNSKCVCEEVVRSPPVRDLWNCNLNSGVESIDEPHRTADVPNYWSGQKVLVGYVESNAERVVPANQRPALNVWLVYVGCALELKRGSGAAVIHTRHGWQVSCHWENFSGPDWQQKFPCLAGDEFGVLHQLPGSKGCGLHACPGRTRLCTTQWLLETVRPSCLCWKQFLHHNSRCSSVMDTPSRRVVDGAVCMQSFTLHTVYLMTTVRRTRLRLHTVLGWLCTSLLW